MKVLFLNSSLTDGGSERAMSLVAQALAQRDHKVTMALVRDRIRTYTIDDRVLVKQFRYTRRNKILIGLQRFRQIRKEVKTGNYDFIVSYMWDINLTTLLATLGLRQRVIVSERSFPGADSRSSFFRILENVFYHRAHKIVYQTQDARVFCPPRLRGRSVVMPNMIVPSRVPLYPGARTKRIVSAGRLTTQKNFPMLIRAFADFHSSNPEWNLEIYGQGMLEEELKCLADELKVGDRVVFGGYVSNLAQEVRDAGIFALASDYEGISNAMTEAMALGIPTVCTDCPAGGAALLIRNNVSGLLVPVGDQTGLARALQKVANNRVLAERLSKGALESVARFSPDHLAKEWEKQVLT